MHSALVFYLYFCNMILYYTGASSSGVEQNMPESSLGGYISSSLIQNSTINNIFSTISKSVVEKGARDVRCIAITNNSPSTIYNAKLWIDNTVSNNHSNLLLGAVAPAFDNCNNAYFEQIRSTDALPYQCVLSSHNGQGNAINLGDIASGESVGLWLSREIKTADFPSANGATNGTSDSAMTALQNSIDNPILEDDSDLIISWDSTTTTTTTTP